MRSVIICLLSLLFVPALGAPAGNQGQPQSSTRLPSVHQLATHEPLIHLAPIKPPSTRPPSTHLPSIHQLPIHQPSTHQPPIRPRPVPPSAHPPPPHGQIVAFQANNAPHAGVILGSQPDQHGRFKIAPAKFVGHDSAQRPVLAAAHNQVVKAHQNDILGTRLSTPSVASVLMNHHVQHPPLEIHATAPVYGSHRYTALHGRPGGRRRR
ncbi:hypothetical protein JOM56_012420 [Amanita muscaria]